MDAYEVARIRERLHVLDGVLRALVQRAEIDSIVWQAADAQVAHRQLMSEPLSFSEIQAHHILDMQIRRGTIADRMKLSNEASELRAALGE